MCERESKRMGGGERERGLLEYFCNILKYTNDKNIIFISFLLKIKTAKQETSIPLKGKTKARGRHIEFKPLISGTATKS